MLGSWNGKLLDWHSSSSPRVMGCRIPNHADGANHTLGKFTFHHKSNLRAVPCTIEACSACVGLFYRRRLFRQNISRHINYWRRISVGRSGSLRSTWPLRCGIFRWSDATCARQPVRAVAEVNLLFFGVWPAPWKHFPVPPFSPRTLQL